MVTVGLLGGWGGGASAVVLEGLGGFGGGTSSVDFVGLGGCGGGASSSRLLGNLGGWLSFCREGNLGGPLARGTAGAEFTDTSGTLILLGLGGGSSIPLSSRPRKFGGGRIGIFAGSKGGGSFLCVSTEEVLVLEDPARDWFKDMPDTLELIDELDPFRASPLEALPGAREGDVSVVARLGRGGGNLRARFGGGDIGGRGLSLSIGGGGSTFFLTPTGKSAEESRVRTGGLFVVWTRVGAPGRFLEGGIGGGGLLPNV